MNASTTSTGQTIFVGLRYTDARAAVAWLERVFGATVHEIYEGDDGSVSHAEVAIAGNLIMFGNVRDDGYAVTSPRQAGAVTAGLYVVLPDAASVDAMYERAVAAGADITGAPSDTDYGSHDVRIRDLDGNPWTFGTYRPTAPAR